MYRRYTSCRRRAGPRSVIVFESFEHLETRTETRDPLGGGRQGKPNSDVKHSLPDCHPEDQVLSRPSEPQVTRRADRVTLVHYPLPGIVNGTGTRRRERGSSEAVFSFRGYRQRKGRRGTRS